MIHASEYGMLIRGVASLQDGHSRDKVMNSPAKKSNWVGDHLYGMLFWSKRLCKHGWLRRRRSLPRSVPVLNFREFMCENAAPFLRLRKGKEGNQKDPKLINGRKQQPDWFLSSDAVNKVRSVQDTRGE